MSGDIINPQSGNANHSSFQYQVGEATGYSSCTTNGSTEPTWPQTAGATVSDGSCTWTNVSGMYGTKQLPCNGLRGDQDVTVGALISGASPAMNVFPVDNNTASNIYQATSSSTLTMTALPNWTSSCPYFGNTCADPPVDGVSDGITWINLGPNDCRSDVVLIDLLSAQL
jgi:hypothetical protein